MGDFAVSAIQTPKMRQDFLRHLLHDVEALDIMLDSGQFETTPIRMGAEQELCVLDADFTPSLAGPAILEKSTDPHLTSEIARYNLEINLDPFVIQGKALSETHRHLDDQWQKVEELAARQHKKLLLCGILPTINHQHLTVDYMSPQERYKILNDIMRMTRGKAFDIQIQGVNELIASLDSVLYEACNTSFQMHLQVAPDDFVRTYNWSQQIAAPVLAAAVNSPFLFGRELWMETRIALFRQSLDMRTSLNHLREKQARVFFGDHWLENSVSDLFKEHIARFPLLVTRPVEEDSLLAIANGDVPALRALRVHNGTVYTWNRPCYGRGGGRPHLRIENRYVGSGPTRVDEIANFAFWLGLMLGQPEDMYHLHERASFSCAKENFYKAARHGLCSIFSWMGKEVTASELILDTLLPMAETGLKKSGLASDDIDYYLGIIRERVEHQTTGAAWQVRNVRRLREAFGLDHALLELTAAMHQLQQDDNPVHTWPSLRSGSIHPLPGKDSQLASIMNTDIFTVQEEEPVSLVRAIMSWRNIRHMPIEDADGNLVGMLTAKDLMRLDLESFDQEHTPVESVMTKPIITGNRFTQIEEAVRQMKQNNIGSFPVTRDQKMVGLVTDSDLKQLGFW